MNLRDKTIVLNYISIINESAHFFQVFFGQTVFLSMEFMLTEVGIKLYYAGGMGSITGRRTGSHRPCGMAKKKKQKTGFSDPPSVLEPQPRRLSTIRQTPVPPTGSLHKPLDFKCNPPGARHQKQEEDPAACEGDHWHRKIVGKRCKVRLSYSGLKEGPFFRNHPWSS